MLVRQCVELYSRAITGAARRFPRGPTLINLRREFHGTARSYRRRRDMAKCRRAINGRARANLHMTSRTVKVIYATRSAPGPTAKFRDA